MTNIKEFMADDHRFCDEVIVRVETAVAAHEWDDALNSFTQAQTLVLQHFDAEETLIFPAFEEKTGMRGGPTQVMRDEHVQMRQLMDAARQALLAKDADDYTGYAETLLIMMQQHNMKEENVLYPMCDQHLGNDLPTLIPQLQEKMPGRAS